MVHVYVLVSIGFSKFLLNFFNKTSNEILMNFSKLQQNTTSTTRQVENRPREGQSSKCKARTTTEAQVSSPVPWHSRTSVCSQSDDALCSVALHLVLNEPYFGSLRSRTSILASAPPSFGVRPSYLHHSWGLLTGDLVLGGAFALCSY